MTGKHVVHFGFGTLLIGLLAIGLLGGCLVIGAMIVASDPGSPSDSTGYPSKYPRVPSGQLGELSQMIESKGFDPNSKEADDVYGKLNKTAQLEEKEGPLLDRIRMRRSAVCQNQYQASAQYQSRRGCQLAPSYSNRSSSYEVWRSTGGVPSRNLDCDRCPQPQSQPQSSPTLPSEVNPTAPRIPAPDIQSIEDYPFLPDSRDCPDCVLGQ